MLIVNLTAGQVEQMAGVYAKIAELSAAGKPGMLVAQVYSDHMRVGILSNEASLKIHDAPGRSERTPRTPSQCVRLAAAPSRER